jgi:hypothetical protein
MKATELRIGNWVRVGDIESTVCLIDHNKFVQLQGNAVINRPEQIEPILLTPEILEKYGAKRTGNMALRKFWEIGNLTFELCGDERIAIYFKDELLCFLEYLHQLQNLYFALTGEELTINI